MTNRFGLALSIWFGGAIATAAGAQSPESASRPIVAEQALAASRAMTSIGPDPCRMAATGEEIVVCGRRESPYALPLYDPDAGRAASQAGSGRDAAMGAAKDTGAPCRARADPCIRPLPILKQKF